MADIITTHWKGGMQFESDNPSGKTVMMDTNVEGSDKRFGLSPKAMMLSALAGCSGIDVLPLLVKMKVVVDDLKMIVQGELTEEHPKYYHTVTVDYHFYGKNLNENKINKAVNLSVEKYCGVMEMFRQFAKVGTKVHFHK
ncbi:MAG: OsmC family protein [Flavobacteriaceae bacterium]|nr:OsmC family protein [Flavobacteriaceae bacterium]